MTQVEATFTINPSDIIRDAADTVRDVMNEHGFVTEADIEGSVEEQVDRMLDRRDLVDSSRAVDIARDTIRDVMREQGSVEDMIDATIDGRELVTRYGAAEIARDMMREGGGGFTRDEVPNVLRSQLESMPRTYGDRCDLGKAFTKAVLHVLNDVLAEATPDGQDAMRKLLGVVDAHQNVHAMLVADAAVVAEADPTGIAPEPYDEDALPRLVPFVRDAMWLGTDADILEAVGVLQQVLRNRGSMLRTWSLVLNETDDEGNVVVVGPFATRSDSLRWTDNTSRSGVLCVNEAPQA